MAILFTAVLFWLSLLRGKPDAAPTSALKCCGKNFATAAKKHVVALKAELAQTTASRRSLIDAAPQSRPSAKDAHAEPYGSTKRLGESEIKNVLMTNKPRKVRQKFVGSATVAEEASDRSANMSERGLLLKEKAGSLKP